MPKNFTESLANYSIEELQKLKLKEEILALKKPFWKQIQFISIVTTLVIAFTGTSITIWQIQNSKIQHAEAERRKYELMMNELKEKSDEANTRYLEAVSEKTAAMSEKTEIKNQINSFQELQLLRREQEIEARNQRLRNMGRELEKKQTNYKKQFIETFVSKNPTVQEDITRFVNDGMKSEMEIWLKEKFLFTALNRYQEFILRETNTSLIE